MTNYKRSSTISHLLAQTPGTKQAQSAEQEFREAEATFLRFLEKENQISGSNFTAEEYINLEKLGCRYNSTDKNLKYKDLTITKEHKGLNVFTVSTGSFKYSLVQKELISFLISYIAIEEFFSSIRKNTSICTGEFIPKECDCDDTCDCECDCYTSYFTHGGCDCDSQQDIALRAFYTAKLDKLNKL